MAAIAWLKGG
ncbi:hypothetical protein VCHC81A2_1408, partial [Vibrio cholerae HC-81A2]